MRVLAGDIGGTKTLLAVAEVEGCHVDIVQEKRYRSADVDDFTSMAGDFLSRVEPRPTHAGFGVAGPVVGGRAEITKLPWVMERCALRDALGLSRVRLINDFVAVAYGTEALGPEDLEVLNPGEPSPKGNIAILGAGTGLGEAMIVQSGEGRVVLPSEGGHRDFAPRDDLETDLLRWMRAKYGRVSYDRVVSGPGIADIYRFLRDTGRGKATEALRRAMDEAEDPAPVIQRFADEEGDPLCEATLELFVSLYAAEAGNLALTAVATGGVYLAGGITPRLIDRLETEAFRASFRSKGRQADLVAAMPVYAVMNRKVGLLGAALSALC